MVMLFWLEYFFVYVVVGVVGVEIVVFVFGIMVVDFIMILVIVEFLGLECFYINLD